MTDAQRELHRRLESIRSELIEMASLVEQMVAKARLALDAPSSETLEELRAMDVEVDRFELAIDEHCHRLFALQQPTAVDMRFLVAVTKMTSSLERIGDLCVDVATSASRMEGAVEAPVRVDVATLFEKASGMVMESLQSFVRRDAHLATRVLERDDEVDHLHDELVARLLHLSTVDSSRLRWSGPLLFAIGRLEEVADQATNIAEDVIYYVEGRDVRHGGG